MEDDMRSNVLAVIARTADRYEGKWRERSEAYWLSRMVQGTGRLASALTDEHDETPDHELLQIAAVAINWLEMRWAHQEELMEALSRTAKELRSLAQEARAAQPGEGQPVKRGRGRPRKDRLIAPMPEEQDFDLGQEDDEGELAAVEPAFATASE